MAKNNRASTRNAGEKNSTERGEPVFPCFRCGICCSGYQIYMNRIEAEKIADFIGINLQIFVDEYSDPRWPGTETFVLRHVAGRCPFLDQPGNSIFGLCRIHEVKPFCCRQWQASIDHKECRRGLSLYWGLSVDDNGELKGSPEELVCFWTFIDSLSEEEESECRPMISSA